MSENAPAPSGTRFTRLCLVRHGETAWNAEHRVQGQLDIPLNEEGHRQARRLAQSLKGEKFDLIYASDLTRTRQTAAPSAELLGLEVIPDPALRERHYGMFETHTYAEVKVRFPAEYARFAARDPEFGFGNGERLKDFYRRSIDAAHAIAARHPGAHILVFTHGGVLDMLYRHIRGLDISAERDFGIPNCGINRIEAAAPAWQIRAWADIAHLERALDDL